MRKKMFAALGIIMMLFAFVACQGEPTTISEEQAKANELAADYISSIRYAEVLNVAFKKGNSALKVVDADATSVTVTFTNYTGDAVPATGDIKGIKEGSLKYTFTTTATKASTKGYTIETVDHLVFSLKDGSTAEDTIKFKISGSCTIELTTDSSNKITGVKSAEFGEVKDAEEITVGDMPVNIEDIEITIDNSTPSTDEPSEPTEKIYTLEKDTKVSEIESLASYDGIKGNDKESEGKYVLTIDKAITISKDFTFDNVILDGNRKEGNKKNTDPGITIDAGTSGVKISVTNSTVRNFGIAFFSADTTLTKGLLTMEITGSDFTECYKGLYVTNLKDLTVKNSKFTDMGADSLGSSDNPTTSDLMKRSGSAFDINQMVAGNSIVIEGSTFSQCGAASTETGTTSGAIKVKIRGGENDNLKPSGDIPKDANGSFAAGLTVESCTFTGNRKDIVIGTDKSVDSADFAFTYTAGSGTKDPKIEDNAENTLVIVKNTAYSEIASKISEYAGIRGAAADCVVVTMDSNTITPKADSTRFALRSVVLQGSAGEEPEAKDAPIGINLSDITKDITLSIVDSEIKNFGTAIMSNKVTGSEGNKSNKEGMLTLIIEDSKFSNCYKGLYVTNLEDLTVTGSTFDRMGEASKPYTSDDPSIPEKMARSGAAFDINQTKKGGDIAFKDSIFTYCGGDNNADKLTSGAIKVKLRGGAGDDATDVPKNTGSSFDSFTIDEKCVFENNRADIVIGTDHVPSTGLSEDVIKAIPEQDAKGNKIDIENNSEAVTETNGQ